MVNLLKTSKIKFSEINFISRFLEVFFNYTMSVLEFSICIINSEKFKENKNYQKNYDRQYLQ